MEKVVLVGLGGAAGTIARYVLSGWLTTTLGSAFPFGTFAVNVVGSFLIAAIMQVATTTDVMSMTTRLMLTTGVLGGFTTYSAFSYETFRYMQDGAYGVAFLNVAATVVACLGACFLGHGLARWVIG